jgi:hypothetical protein
MKGHPVYDRVPFPFTNERENVMADFNDLLNTARNPGDDGVPDTIYDDLGAAYNDRINSADAKINELSTAHSAAEAELQRVRAHNYELLSSVQAGNPPKPTTGAQQDVDDEPVISLSDIISYG